MPRPIYIALLDIAVCALWSGFIIPGTILVWMAASMEV